MLIPQVVFTSISVLKSLEKQARKGCSIASTLAVMSLLFLDDPASFRALHRAVRCILAYSVAMRLMGLSRLGDLIDPPDEKSAAAAEGPAENGQAFRSLLDSHTPDDQLLGEISCG